MTMQPVVWTNAESMECYLSLIEYDALRPNYSTTATRIVYYRRN